MVAQKAVNVRMITAHMDTMTAVVLLTDSVTTTPIITASALCLLLLAQAAVLLGEALRRQTHTLTLESETLLLLLTLHDVTCTEMTEDGVSIGLTITVGVDRLTPHSQGIPLLSGPRGNPPKLLIPLKKPLCPLGEVRGLDLTADLQALIQSAAQAAQAVAVIQTAAQVMDRRLVLFSHQLHMHHLSPLWRLTLKSPVGALGLKCKIYQYAQQTQV